MRKATEVGVTLLGLVVCILVLYLFWDSRCSLRFHFRQPRDNTRPWVIGTGLSRTGTSSLTCALKQLGWRAFHFPFRFRELESEYRKHCNALTDWALIGLRPLELKEKFPGAIFVHTERDRSSWIKSMQKLERIFRCCSLLPARLLHTFHKTYGKTPIEWTAFYDEYEKEVAQVNPQVRLNICKGEGWSKLCAFFNLPAPPTNFPHKAEVVLQLHQTFGRS